MTKVINVYFSGWVSETVEAETEEELEEIADGIAEEALNNNPDCELDNIDWEE